MWRAALAALALFASASCAHAQERRDDGVAAQAVARVMIEALAPASGGDRAYGWDALSIRVSRHMHWHLVAPDPLDRAPDGLTRRNGWITAQGSEVGVSAHGPDERVSQLKFEVSAFYTQTLLEALRAEGVDVAFQADWEESSEYLITPPGREGGMLTSARVCTPPESRATQRCHNELTLAFELP